MEYIITLLLLVIFFMSFWIRNLILTLKNIAIEKEEMINVINEYLLSLNSVMDSKFNAWAGEPTFKKLKEHTTDLMHYLINKREMYNSIEFLYESDTKNNKK